MKIATASWKTFHQCERILICVAERGVIKYHPCPALLSHVKHLWHIEQHIEQMDVHLSIKANLLMAASAAQELKSTMEEFNRACNTLSELAFQRDLHRKYDIHHQGYRLVRQETDLPAQYVINAIARVSAVYTRDSNKWYRFKPHSSVRYDAKSMTLRPDCQTVCVLSGVGIDLTTNYAHATIRTYALQSISANRSHDPNRSTVLLVFERLGLL
jgi:hypothetical protein